MKPLLLLSLFLFMFGCSRPVEAPAPLLPVPTEAQLQWHDMRMNAFIHFTINTFTDREWGQGSESPKEFNPTDLDVDQWVRVLAETGFKGVILTCKHHDGFCLWPSQYTQHTVAASPLLGGKADIVRMVSDACKKYNLKFGVYLSPWDRNHREYGKPEYVDYYRKQLDELFNAYGPIFEMWFDGANGGDGYYGGANEVRKINGATYYDWPTTLDQVRKHNPDVIFFSDAGPGVRWVGNEKGIAGETNWNTISVDTLYAGKAGIEKLLNTGDPAGMNWVPAETDVSIRPGWFYHSKEDSLVKTPAQLFDIYLTSVGRGSLLLLNVPPDRRGRLHERDVESLKGFRAMLDEAFATNLARGAKASATNVRGSADAYSASLVADQDANTYWATDDGLTNAAVELELASAHVKYIVLKEYIRLGQRVKAFTIQARENGEWKDIATGTTIGHERILRVDSQTDGLRLVIQDARACPLISAFEAY